MPSLLFSVSFTILWQHFCILSTPLICCCNCVVLLYFVYVTECNSCIMNLYNYSYSMVLVKGEILLLFYSFVDFSVL